MQPPRYFHAISQSASARWNQLERDPELAAPWHQLFKQVQSPRHVLSELLQNADDAGANQAIVRIDEGTFFFAHNGEDFAEEHFRSLCRFGYSNKRSLHTIGFRGIGFKSTFSIGDEVQLYTPTLSVLFHRDRFTQPLWVERSTPASGWTEIRVRIQDEHRERELVKNLEEWSRSPVSLLFFRSIRSLVIGEETIRWENDGAGPVPDSEWLKLSTAPDRRYLLVRSEEEAFPEAALAEIRQERMAMDGEMAFPPCRVEIVLGMEGRLFVVLPTGVKTNLPFACSAPFVQDPARVKIKDPEISPTNRWLLKRIGHLAARALLAWAGNSELPVEQRAEAYQLWMGLGRGDNSLEGNCAAIVGDAFRAVVENAPCLLAENGMLERWQRCLTVPAPLLDVWSAEQVSTLFTPSRRPILSRHILEPDRQKLVKANAVTEIAQSGVVGVLRVTHPPRPQTWRQLMVLWAYLSDAIRSYWNRPAEVRIVPVQGADVLYASSEVVRLGEKQLLQSQDDWAFLGKQLLVLNQNWTRYLADRRREAEEEKRFSGGPVEAAYQALREIGLEETSDLGRVMAMVAERFFKQDSCSRLDCIRLAQIAAKLGASVPETFEFVTEDGYRRTLTDQILLDTGGDLDLFADSTWLHQHMLHPDYAKRFLSCTESEWRQWSSSPRSGLLTFVPVEFRQRRVFGKEQILAEMERRGLQGDVTFPYQGTEFIVEDWDFADSVWEKWRRTATEDHGFWVRVMVRIMKQPQSYWMKATAARAAQVARNGHSRAISQEALVPGWIQRFRDLPCLQDTWGQICRPADLLRRTPETEALLDAEPFIRAEFDTEALRPLLVLLGVRDTPTGPASLMERLRALAQVANPPLPEVQKWYHRLDQMVEQCSTDEFRELMAAFQTSNLVLTESHGWVRSTDVFLTADEDDAPGAPIIHPSVRYLSLWRKLNMPERPTAELALAWLKGLPVGRILSADELRRVRALLPRYPDRVWTECGHWLNLDGEWVTTTTLKYALSMQSLVPWSHLFSWAKAQTADFQKLPTDVCERAPFSDLPRLGSCIEERFREKPGGVPRLQSKPWITALGANLERIILDDEKEKQRVSALGKRLAQTHWKTTTGLETEPYLAGSPAGTPRRTNALWRGEILYVEDRSAAQMAAAVPQELGRAFDRTEISDAIKLCYERSPEFVAEFLQTTFKLAPAEAIVQPEPVTEQKPAAVELGLYEAAVTREEDGAAPPAPVEVAHPVEPQVPQPEEARPHQAKPAKPTQTAPLSLIERFALAIGFARDGGDRFYHKDGSCLSKALGGVFPWERRSATGEPLQYYWVNDHCIERAPLQVDSEVWLLCEQFPDQYSLILVSPDGHPLAISGRRLVDLRDRGQIVLHPATYRLVYQA